MAAWEDGSDSVQGCVEWGIQPKDEAAVFVYVKCFERMSR